MLRRPQLILFDLDGTLVDSVPDLANAVDAMLGDLGLSARGQLAVRGWVGNGIERLVKRALTGEMEAEPAAALFERGLESFRAHYEACNGRDSVLFPGVAATLRRLHADGFALACITNKSQQFSLPLLAALGVDDCFSKVISGDSLQVKKPDPGPLLAAADALAVPVAACLMVGDSVHDVNAARAAGMPVVGVSYGYNHGLPIAAAEPDAVVDSLAALDQLWPAAA